MTLENKLNQIKEDLQKQKGKIKQIPFSLYVKTEGIVNFNGNTFGLNNCIYNEKQRLRNFQFPKMENAPTQDVNENYFSDNFKESHTLISSNCFKNGMYKNEAFALNNVENPQIWLLNAKGLLNGFVIAKDKNNSHRTSPVFLSDLLSSFLKNEDEDVIGKLKDFGLTDDHLEKNGKLKLDYRTKEGEDSTSFTLQVLNQLKYNFYKSIGVIDLDKLQFISIGGELGRDCIANQTEKEIENVLNAMILFLNNMKSEVLESRFLVNNKFRKLLDYVKNNEVAVSAGAYRRYGNLAQLEKPALCENGILLNKTAICVLLLKYFDLMLQTQIVKNHANLETLFVEVDFENLDFCEFYEFVSDYKFVKKDNEDKDNKKNKNGKKPKNAEESIEEKMEV